MHACVCIFIYIINRLRTHILCKEKLFFWMRLIVWQHYKKHISYWFKQDTHFTDRWAQRLKVSLSLCVEPDGAAGIHTTKVHLPGWVTVKRLREKRPIQIQFLTHSQNFKMKMSSDANVMLLSISPPERSCLGWRPPQADSSVGLDTIAARLEDRELPIREQTGTQ